MHFSLMFTPERSYVTDKEIAKSHDLCSLHRLANSYSSCSLHRLANSHSSCSLHRLADSRNNDN